MSGPACSRGEVLDAMSALRRYVEAHDYAGIDPYDALNSPILRRLTRNSRWGRIAATQILRRSVVNFRPALGVRPGHNPKALALFLEGYVRLAAGSAREAERAAVERLIGLLRSYRSQGTSGHGWGYNFDWQSRALFAPKYTPNVVVSSFAGHALLDAYEMAGFPEAADLAAPVAGFMLGDLNRIRDGDTFCFSYTPLDRYAVHNANLLGASFLARLGKLLDKPALIVTALQALAYSMQRQRDDGSWFYSESEGAHFIDSFHTGFNLEAIRRFLRLGLAAHYESAYQRGVRFYAARFFLADGTPKYFHDRLYPVDIHSAAEAIAFFSSAGSVGLPLAAAVLDWTLRNMCGPEGTFYFRKGRNTTIRTSYMRWAQAWMFRAMTAYLSAASASGSPGTERELEWNDCQCWAYRSTSWT